jgi:hypothetical protein
LGLAQLIVGGTVSVIEMVWLQKLLKPHGFETSHDRVTFFGQMPLVTVLNTAVVLLQLPFKIVGGSNVNKAPHGMDLFVAQPSSGTGLVTVTVWLQ